MNDFNNMMRDSTTDYWDFVIIRAGFGVDALAHPPDPLSAVMEPGFVRHTLLRMCTNCAIHILGITVRPHQQS